MQNLFDGLNKLGFTKLPQIDSIFHNKPGQKEQSSDSKEADVEGVFDIAKYVFLKNRICPVCDHGFTDIMMLKSKCRYLYSDTDLRAYFSPLEPMFYDVVCCHFCGYAAMNSHFDQISEKQIDLIIEAIKPQFKYKEYPLNLSVDDAEELYQLALLCATVKQTKASEKAMLCLRMAWIAREQKKTEREQQLMQVALEGFGLAYEREDFPMYGMEPMTLCYLMGELSRRIGRNDDALRYLGRVIVSKEANSRLKERARDVQDLIRK